MKSLPVDPVDVCRNGFVVVKLQHLFHNLRPHIDVLVQSFHWFLVKALDADRTFISVEPGATFSEPSS